MLKKNILFLFFISLSMQFNTHSAGFIRSFFRYAWNTPVPTPQINIEKIDTFCLTITDPEKTDLERRKECIEKICSLTLDKEKCAAMFDFFVMFNRTKKEDSSTKN